MLQSEHKEGTKGEERRGCQKCPKRERETERWRKEKEVWKMVKLYKAGNEGGRLLSAGGREED